MKVLHVLNELRPSGAEIMLNAAADYFNKNNVESWIIATGASAGPYAETLKKSGYHILHIPTISNPTGLLTLFRTLKKIRPDVVHVHAERLSYWICLLALGAGCRVVRTFHGIFRFDGLLRIRRQLQRQHLEYIGVKSIAISPSVQENEIFRFKISPSVIDNWIDMQNFPIVDPISRTHARSFFPCTSSTFIILTVGNCSSIKNHTAVLQAMARIGDKLDLLYLHVGLEEDACPEQQLAQSLGILNRVIFTGKTSRVIDYLHACDLFIMPSLHEGFGLAAAEAIASGANCLFTNVDGLKDFRSNFPAIHYCDPTADSIAECIFYLHNCSQNDSQQAQKSTSADHARKFFNPHRGAREYLDLYRGTTCIHQ